MQVDKQVIAVADGIKEYEAEIAELKAALKKTADWAEELGAANLKLISEITALSAEIRSIRHEHRCEIRSIRESLSGHYLNQQQYAQMHQNALAQQNALQSYSQQNFAAQNLANSINPLEAGLPDRPSEEDPNVCTCVPSRHGFFRRWG